VHLPKPTLDALDELAKADECTPADVVERLVAEEHTRRFDAREAVRADPVACSVCGKQVPASRGARTTCSARCARKSVAGLVRYVVFDGARRASAHAKEADANAAAEVVRTRSRTPDGVRVMREEL
jgi:hypothetical protein